MATPSLTTLTSNSATTRFQWRAQRSYYADVPALALDEQSRLIEQLIGLAFDVLGARHLDVRVRCADQAGFARLNDPQRRKLSNVT